MTSSVNFRTYLNVHASHIKPWYPLPLVEWYCISVAIITPCNRINLSSECGTKIKKIPIWHFQSDVEHCHVQLHGKLPLHENYLCLL